MNLKRLFVLGVSIFFLSGANCSAEHPKAQEYRKILSSENFYVEYDDKNIKRIVAQDNGRRMARTNLGGAYQTIVSILNPLGAVFSNEKFPEFMYAKGKFYKFLEDDFALMAEEKNLDDENLNPAEGWSTIYQSLSLPNELAIFNWHDRFHKVPPSMSEPVFVESTKKIVAGKEYDCDRYESKITNAEGSETATIIFNLCYAGGELALASSALSSNGKDYEINSIVLKKILPQVPNGGFKLNGKEKIHSAGMGDMNDLLEGPAFIGQLANQIETPAEEFVQPENNFIQADDIASQINSSGTASKVDAYQKILESGRYTIRYDNLTPSPRITNRNVVELYGKNGLAAEGNEFFLNRPLSGVVISDGEDRYEEVGYQNFFQCRLLKGGENFIFTRYPSKSGGMEYFGEKRGRVSPNPRNYMIELLSGLTFGDSNFTEMMTAITSESMKSSTQRKYKFVTSGTLSNGLTYEDFSFRDGKTVSAIRYYFDGDELKKISFASYGKDGKNVRARKCIVKILEFTAAPDQKLLSLPSGLVDSSRH
ncbi:MAG: hypothetical protein IJS69_01190 [Selenomonadaceae bacterium]|nr:hypothetical protein [Selenomonadaceae bacterium]